MRRSRSKKEYIFVDESGDPTFYDAKGRFIVGKGGCSKALILGFVRMADPKGARKVIEKLRAEIMADEYLKTIPSVAHKTAAFFHATDDVPEVRERFFKAIKKIDFSCNFIVARKIEPVFRNYHRNSEEVFYNDLITHLFWGQLHLSRKYVICFSARGSSTRQEVISKAVQTAINMFKATTKIDVRSSVTVHSQGSAGDPCLQIVDYMNWAVHRAFSKRDLRYLKFMFPKVAYLSDYYFDYRKKGKAGSKQYGRRLSSDINTISPL